MKFILSTLGFILIAFALGLLIWAGYEMGLIILGNYDPSERATIDPLVGTLLVAAALSAISGRGMRRLAKRRRWRPR
jgi:hypothetical protein